MMMNLVVVVVVMMMVMVVVLVMVNDNVDNNDDDDDDSDDDNDDEDGGDDSNGDEGEGLNLKRQCQVTTIKRLLKRNKKQVFTIVFVFSRQKPMKCFRTLSDGKKMKIPSVNSLRICMILKF